MRAGRTGTLVAALLGRLYGLDFVDALHHTQIYHDSRIYPQGVRSPQTPVQRAQVRRLLAMPTAVQPQVQRKPSFTRPGNISTKPYGARATAVASK